MTAVQSCAVHACHGGRLSLLQARLPNFKQIGGVGGVPGSNALHWAALATSPPTLPFGCAAVAGLRRFSSLMREARRSRGTCEGIKPVNTPHLISSTALPTKSKVQVGLGTTSTKFLERASSLVYLPMAGWLAGCCSCCCLLHAQLSIEE